MYVKKTVLGKCEDMKSLLKKACNSRGHDGESLFTRAELDYCAERIRCLGARFLIKHCILDYLEHEMGSVAGNYRDIEIINDEYRKPVLRLSDGISGCLRELKIKDVPISIAHSRRWITGMVLFCYH